MHYLIQPKGHREPCNKVVKSVWLELGTIWFWVDMLCHSPQSVVEGASIITLCHFIITNATGFHDEMFLMSTHFDNDASTLRNTTSLGDCLHVLKSNLPVYELETIFCQSSNWWFKCFQKWKARRLSYRVHRDHITIHTLILKSI